MFKLCSGHVSGVADLTSVYKRNTAHTQLAICVCRPLTSSPSPSALEMLTNMSVEMLMNM